MNFSAKDSTIVFGEFAGAKRRMMGEPYIDAAVVDFASFSLVCETTEFGSAIKLHLSGEFVRYFAGLRFG